MNEPHMAPWWFPANDHPRDKAAVDIHITVPREHGRWSPTAALVSRKVHGDQATTHWRAVEPMAPYLAFFAAGPYETRQRRPRRASVVRRGLPAAVRAARSAAR